jgi:hypothetical protein
MICEAILAAEEVVVTSGLEVYLVCFNVEQFEAARPFLPPVVTKTGGKIIIAK